MRASLLQSMRRVPEHTPGGLYIGERLAFKVGLGRLFRVVERTVKGLYFKETGRRISDEYDVRVHSDETLATLDPRDLEVDTRNVIEPLRRLAPKVNARQRSVNWQFRTADARLKLKSLYPKLCV